MVFYGDANLYMSINATPSINNGDVKFDSNKGAFMDKSHLNATLCGKNISSIGNVISFDLNKGDYISMYYYASGSMTYTTTLYVYTR